MRARLAVLDPACTTRFTKALDGLGPVHTSKVDISDGFYNVCLCKCQQSNSTRQASSAILLPQVKNPWLVLFFFFLGLPGLLPIDGLGVVIAHLLSTNGQTGVDVANRKNDASWALLPHRWPESKLRNIYLISSILFASERCLLIYILQLVSMDNIIAHLD